MYIQKLTNMLSIRKSPWAKLTMFITPQMSVSPIAMSAYTQPMSSPLTSCWRSCSTMGDGYFVPHGRSGQATSRAADSKGHTLTYCCPWICTRMPRAWTFWCVCGSNFTPCHG